MAFGIETLLNRSDAVAVYGLTTAGVLHSLIPVFEQRVDEDALWFAGTGLAFCFLGLLNLLRRATGNPIQARWFCRVANSVALVHMLLVTNALRKPHVYLVLAFIGFVTIYSFIPPTTKQPIR